MLWIYGISVVIIGAKLTCDGHEMTWSGKLVHCCGLLYTVSCFVGLTINGGKF